MPHIELITNADAKTTRPTWAARSQATEIFNKVIGPHVPPGREVQIDIASNRDTGITKVHFFTNYTAPELYDLTKIAAELACITQQSWADSPLMLLVRHRAQSAHEQIELTAEIQRLKPKTAIHATGRHPRAKVARTGRVKFQTPHQYSTAS